MSDKLIVALDYYDWNDAWLGCVQDLGDLVDFYKVGWQLFINDGPRAIEKLHRLGKRIFLDLKIEDTPDTVRKTLTHMAFGDAIDLITIKGDAHLVEAAKQGLSNWARPAKVLMLTILSSTSHIQVGDRTACAVERAQQASDKGCDGVVASGDAVFAIREQIPNTIIVVPGIRLLTDSVNDHKNVLTPYLAIIDGADYLVVGRPITKAPNVVKAAQKFITEIQYGEEYVQKHRENHIRST